MIKHREIYKLDNNGRVRVWWAEIEGDKIRNVSGLLDGEKVYSGWKQMKPKNTGKTNATTPEQQAEAEVAALYEKQLGKGGYHENIEDVDKKKYIEPMLAHTFDIGKIIFPVDCQPKLDGHRCIATKEGLTTRNGKRYVAVPHIEFALMKLFEVFPDLILDGELYNHDLRDNFNEISSCVRKTKPNEEDLMQSSKIEYHVYDVVNGGWTWNTRREFIENLQSSFNHPKIKFVETHRVDSQHQLDQYYSRYIEMGYEGQMVRHPDEVYEIGKRSKFLLKRKEFITEEYELVDILSGEGNWEGYAKTLRYRLEDGRIASSGLRGNQEFTKKLLEEKDKWIGGEITLRYFEKTPDGIPRFPVAIEFFEGKRDI